MVVRRTSDRLAIGWRGVGSIGRLFIPFATDAQKTKTNFNDLRPRYRGLFLFVQAVKPWWTTFRGSRLVVIREDEREKKEWKNEVFNHY